MASAENTPQIDGRDMGKVAEARTTAGVLRFLAWGAAGLGVVSLAFIGFFWLEGSMTGEQAVGGAITSGFFTIFAGATAYGSGSNLDVNASRLERQIRSGQSQGEGGHEDLPDKDGGTQA